MGITNNYKKHTSKNPIQRFFLENFYKSLLKTVADIKADKILDAGCGEGFILAKFKNRWSEKQLVGIDNSLAAIALGKKIHPLLDLSQGDINALPYNDNEFDLVICSEVLEHLESPEIALKEIRRTSKRYCLLSVPNEPFFMISNFLRGKNIKRWGNDIEHINHWSVKSFKKFIEESSWKPLVIKTPFPWILVLGEKNG